MKLTWQAVQPETLNPKHTWPLRGAGNEVTLPNIMAANGVIHGIDDVITPVAVVGRCRLTLWNPS